MTRTPIAVLAIALAGVGCDDLGIGGSRQEMDYALHEERARSYEQSYRTHTHIIRTYRAWQARIRAEDLAPMRLPQAGEGDDAFRPVVADSTFCDRLPDQPIPTPESLVAEYRRHARVYRASMPVQKKFARYRGMYLRERQLARLACLADDGGPEHRRAFLELLHDDLEAVRFTAALHAINHEWAPDAGRETLRGFIGNGYSFFSTVADEALRAETTPIDETFDPNFWLDYATKQLQLRKIHRRWVRNSGKTIRR